jgi:hypothetical protein
VTSSLLVPLALMVGVGIPSAAVLSSAMALIQTSVAGLLGDYVGIR